MPGREGERERGEWKGVIRYNVLGKASFIIQSIAGLNPTQVKIDCLMCIALECLRARYMCMYLYMYMPTCTMYIHTVYSPLGRIVAAAHMPQVPLVIG